MNSCLNIQQKEANPEDRIQKVTRFPHFQDHHI